MEYLFKSIACLLLFLLVHRLFLQQEVLHRFNRFFLLAAVLLSFLIPLNQIEVPSLKQAHLVEEEFSQPENFSVNEGFTPTEIEYSNKPEAFSNWDWSKLLWGIYFLISLVFLFRFLRNFQLLISKINSNIQVNYRGQTLILLPENTLPYSFLKYIFVSKDGFESEGLSDAVFEHERVHVVEKHSWDLIFVELLLIPLWFHPGLYWLRHAIRLNHEFIADRSAIQRTEITDYQYELIRLAQSGTPSALVSTLNYSLTKKRIQMMTKTSKPIHVAWKFLAVVPILGLIYYGFSEKVIAQSDKRNSEVHIYSGGNERSENTYDLAFYLDPSGKIYQEGEKNQKDHELSELDQWL
ncbi:M56 family metallopeptidase [Algoriphagus hitonicola]|uniref:BlaR1 peptidase M56 n=1 Tax=Algoriphagus hitonicola TaxID=435880 RepID=A0A1I2P326_9BACT|nr:M56 family metallopeptidase [Algoriphagus hitonicola]SFG08317.1 BlaR1 peptidase M56 [Algoriphagus hitonicola]